METRCGDWEYRARLAHAEIEILDGLTRGFIFSTPGKQTVLYLPDWVVAEYREEKIAKLLLDLHARCYGEGLTQRWLDALIARAGRRSVVASDVDYDLGA